MTNTMFPGRPKYTGPDFGVFGMLHHDTLVEASHCVSERVRYVKYNKPKLEVKIRLHNMIYLGDCPGIGDYRAKHAPLRADYKAKCATVWADYEAKCAQLLADYEAKHATVWADYEAKCAQLLADYEAKCALLDAPVLEYIRKFIPDCAWNGRNIGWL